MGGTGFCLWMLSDDPFYRFGLRCSSFVVYQI